MKLMKKILLAIAALLILCVIVTACSETQLSALYDAVASLLTETHNVTVQGKATFYLDGDVFKHATATQIQVGSDYFRDIYLLTPINYFDNLESGYTILAVDDQYTSVDCFGYICDQYRYPEQRGIIWDSVKVHTLMDLGRSIANVTGALLPQDAVTMEGQATHIVLTADTAPALMNNALNLLLQYFGEKRWVDYDFHRFYPTIADVYDYGTITEGILYCTAEIAINDADIYFSVNADGSIADISGSVTLLLNTESGYSHLLSIEFSVAATDYGTSELPDIDLTCDARW